MLPSNPIGFALRFAPAFLALPAFAQHRATPEPGALRVEVTPEGAFYRTVPFSTGDPTGGYHANVGGALIWSYPDGGLAWIGDAVSIGKNGSEVFTEYDLNNQSAQLFSVNDTNPPTPIWTDNSPLGTDNHSVASAEATNTKIAMHTVGGSSVVLSKYTSASPTPDWTYTFPFAGGSRCGISRDGLTIVAAVGNSGNASADIAVFTPASNVPVSYTQVPIGASNDIRGFDLSADGSTLYFSAAGNPVNAYIFDIASATVVFTQLIGASFDSHAISGDGSVFAFGNFNSMSVYEKSGATYTNTYTQSVAGQCYCAVIDISDDSKTIACGYTFYSTYLPIKVFAIDVPTKTTTMTDTVTATGSFQNIVSAISISADGQRFAVGLWGDGSGPVEEARMYARNQNTAIGTVNLPGSVFGIQISADGTKMVSGSKAVHANQFGNGGSIDLWGESSSFTPFCAGGVGGIISCPCGNAQSPAGSTKGCNNFVAGGTGGAILAGSGSAVTNAGDTVLLNTTAAAPAVTVSVLFQGTTNTVNTRAGAGLRCVGGTLKRLYKGNTAGGAINFPNNAVPVHTQSANKGFVITAPVTLYYYTAYRNAAANGQPGCPGLSFGFNETNALAIHWTP